MIRLLRVLWCDLFHEHALTSYSRQGRWTCITPGCLVRKGTGDPIRRNGFRPRQPGKPPPTPGSPPGEHLPSTRGPRSFPSGREVATVPRPLANGRAAASVTGRRD